MLYRERVELPQLLRHRCRNPRCGSSLRVPAANPRDAFCRRSCERQFYDCRCRVCEALLNRKTKRRAVCWRAKCRYQFKRHPEDFFGSLYPREVVAHNGARNPAKPGFLAPVENESYPCPPAGPVAHNEGKTPLKSRLKNSAKSDRGWRVIAGPEVPEINLRIPLEVPVSKANQAFPKFWEQAESRALIQHDTPPVNIVGGYKFPNAPAIDLSDRPDEPVGGTQ
jgi:hypothetical protein